jgi:hypothetical protein
MPQDARRIRNQFKSLQTSTRMRGKKTAALVTWASAVVTQKQESSSLPGCVCVHNSSQSSCSASVCSSNAEDSNSTNPTSLLFLAGLLSERGRDTGAFPCLILFSLSFLAHANWTQSSRFLPSSFKSVLIKFKKNGTWLGRIIMGPGLVELPLCLVQ